MFRKHYFLAFLLLLFVSTATRPIQAAEKFYLFGIQRNADYPYVSLDGRLLVVDTKENLEGFQVWDVASKKPLWKSNNRTLWLSLSPDSQTILVARATSPIGEDLPALQEVNLELHSARDGRLLRTLEFSPLQPLAPGTTQSSTVANEPLLDFDFSKDGREFRLATDAAVRRWNLLTGHAKPVVKWATPNSVTSVALVPDKEQALVFAGELSLVNAQTGKAMRTLAEDAMLSVGADAGNFLQVSPDGFSFHELRDDTDATRVFRLSDGKQLWSSPDWPTFSPDGKRAFVPSSSGLDVFDGHTGRKFQSLPGPTTYGFDPSPDGKWLYEGRDGKIWKWHAR